MFKERYIIIKSRNTRYEQGNEEVGEDRSSHQ